MVNISYMRFAILNDEKVEPFRGGQGGCPACGSDMTAKCGEQKVWHWAHKAKRHCDHWWSNETEWHRSWKENFPADWQEVPVRDESGVLHIADVRTPSGSVIEFQHSPISASERRARETFYGSMIWVVDGTRSKRDHSTFMKHIKNKMEYSNGDQNIDFNPIVPKITQRWNDSTKPIYFDFGADGLWRTSIEMKGIWQKHASRVDRRKFIDAILAKSGAQDGGKN